MNIPDSTFVRIKDQASKALNSVGFETPVGLYGVSIREMRLGNIIAIAVNAYRGGPSYEAGEEPR